MTDQPNIPEDALRNTDPARDDDARVDAIIVTPRTATASDPYDLEWLFLSWAWDAGYRDWADGVRALARMLRGLERTGLVERRTIRRAGKPTHHGFVPTDSGRRALVALSGEWIPERD